MLNLHRSKTAGDKRRRFVLGCLLFVPAPFAFAGELTTDAKPCAREIRIDADAVPLGQVLERMSQALDFQLTVETDLNEPISMHRQGPPDELLRRLTRDRNAVVRTAASERCKGRETVARIWVLPKGADAPITTAPQQPTAAVAPSPAVTLKPATTMSAPEPAVPKRARGGRTQEKADGGEPPLPRDLHHLERGSPPGYLRARR